jgi:hypothetical protein
MKLLNKKENFYQETFNLYKSGSYDMALQQIVNAPEDIKTDESYAPKLDFLEAMCVGSTKGEEAYIIELENLVKRYPNTPEEIKAKEILRFIKGDSKAFESLIYSEGMESFCVGAGQTALHFRGPLRNKSGSADRSEKGDFKVQR